MKNHKYLIIVSLLLIASFILFTIGLSYSLFNLQVKGTTKNKITTGEYAFSLKDDILNNNEVITATPTLTTSFSNTSDTSGLYKSTATNDGSPTYYFRGNVENNYIDFAGFTWRIVRINEDGTIRIVMQDGINNNNTYQFYSSDSEKKFYSDTVSTGAKYEVDTWYSSNIANNTSYTENISSGNYFCQKYVTMHSSSSHTYTFNCNTADLVNSSVGLLTVEEVKFAGGDSAKTEEAYYLNNNQNFWLMNYGGVPGMGIHTSWYVKNGAFWVNNFTTLYTLRPVINLKSDVMVVGNGTSGNHYVVK